MANDLELRKSKFLNKACDIHNNKYDYSEVKYINSTKKVDILCPNGHIFKQSPNKHLQGQGCPECNRNKKMTLFGFISKSNKVHNNKYGYDYVNYKNSNSYIDINCDKHGIFKQKATNHLQGQGCPKCKIDRMKIDESEFLKRLNIKNDKIKIISDYISYEENILIEVGGYEIETTPKRIIDNKNYGYVKFESGKKICVGKFIDKLNKKFPKHYEIVGDYISYYDKLTLKCLITNKTITKTKALNFIFSKRCKCCYDEELRIKNIDIDLNKNYGNSFCDFLTKANIVHNNEYEYIEESFKSSKEDVDIICKKHGIFKIKAVYHLHNKSGCPKCKESKGERKIRNFLEDMGIVFEQEKIFDNMKNGKSFLRFDFYLPEYNLCIEYDGIQHFESVEYFGGDEYFNKVKINDSIKNNFCDNENIKLLRISYKDFGNIIDILKDKFEI